LLEKKQGGREQEEDVSLIIENFSSIEGESRSIFEGGSGKESILR
jgi:hypothetical protein